MSPDILLGELTKIIFRCLPIWSVRPTEFELFDAKLEERSLPPTGLVTLLILKVIKVKQKKIKTPLG